MDSLTQQQRDAVGQYIDITNASEDSAVEMMTRCNWDVAMGVQAHFDGVIPNVPPPTAAAAAAVSVSSSSSSSSSSSPVEAQRDRVGSPGVDSNQSDPAPRINGTVPLYAPTGNSIMQTVLLAPLNIGVKMFNTVMYFLSWIFPFFPRITGYYPANRAAVYTGNDSNSSTNHAKNAACRLIREFEETYGENRLPFYEGGYAEALDKARSDLKYLIVVLLSPEHDLTANFCRNVLLDSPGAVGQLLGRDDVVFWAGDVQQSEAYQVAYGLKVSKFPFYAVIGPSPKSPTSSTVVMEVIGRASGKAILSAEEFVSIIEEKIESHRPKLMALTLDRQERQVERQLRQEQDSAYERSLAADRERERSRQEQARKQQEEEARKQQQIREEQELLAKKAEWKLWRAQQLQPKLELASQVGAENNSSSQPLKVARISIRLLTGERVVQKFNFNDTVDDIYAFVECFDVLHSTASSTSTSSDHAAPADYQHTYGFHLLSPMPRRILKPDSGFIESEKAIWPNGTLIVEQDDGDDENDDE